MNRNAWMLLLFAVCCAAWFAVPASMIVRHESTLADGQVYLFRCAPVDPVDPFRGRYVALNFDQSRFEGRVPEALVPGSTAYATLAQDDDGFAVISAVGETAPRDRDYLTVRIGWSSADSTQLELPFDRYYMEESLAPDAERAYRERAPGEQAWVSVRVRGGHAALEELYLDGQPIREFLDRSPAGP
jgi:uncharacterized membrane-anchored protein